MKLEKSSGIVHLVGAGPGDVGLITVKGRLLLEQADVVVYDYLANPKLLDYCPQAEIIYVGKKAADHTMSQEQINQLLIDHAKLGKRVVRLKGGDPFVFGRGGEECEALHAANIKFEIVPGITAAIAGPAYAGIPVTHRDFNSSFTLITGHEKEEEFSDLDWPSIAKLPCIAFYMGVKSLPKICEKLIENGMSRATPAAVIQWATTPKQRTITATVETIAQAIEAAGLTAPAITIIGKVVTLRPILNWFELKPLFGKTILVTRTRQQASDLSTRLTDLGANVIEAPTIELVKGEPIADVSNYDWIIFTSVNGVQFTKQQITDSRLFGRAKIAAIGDSTAAAIRHELCLNVDLCPKSFVAEALADELAARNEIAGKRFLLLRADIARTVLLDRLRLSAAAEVRDVPIYKTIVAKSLPPELLDALNANKIDWITFTSSSTVKNFMHLLNGKSIEKIKLASIGPITTQTLAELGLKPDVQAETFTLDGLVTAILNA